MNKSAVFCISNGDIFKSKNEAFVNPVNCYGIMGKGLALQFKKRFPDMYIEYNRRCRERKMFVGNMFNYVNSGCEFPYYIICFPTKIGYQNPSDIRYIKTGLKALKNTIISKGIHSIAIPALGCGLGGLDFDIVLDCIQSELYDLRNIVITIFPPKGNNKWEKINA